MSSKMKSKMKMSAKEKEAEIKMRGISFGEFLDEMEMEQMILFKQLYPLIGHRVFIEKTDEVSFVYENFELDLDSYINVAVLIDGNNPERRLFIPAFGLEDIVIEHGDDLNNMYVEIDSTHHNWKISCDE